ncbi:MAG: Plug domain-containing protein, partial [Parvularculaceae bacterium]|nr:Plug domain-containing protein [Parvularculaceae bacterium]
MTSASLFALTFMLQAVADEIIVSAERRDSAKTEAPMSVSIIQGDEILRINADHPAEALNRSAGVLIHRGNGQEHLTAIRSPVLTSGAGAGSFLYLEDNVPLRAAGFANVNGLFEAHTEIAGRIEV